MKKEWIDPVTVWGMLVVIFFVTQIVYHIAKTPGKLFPRVLLFLIGTF